MSVHDLKQRLVDVPGIESLTMALEGGRILVRWGAGYSAAADASASDYEIEVAVRNAIKLPPVSAIPEKQLIPNAAPILNPAPVAPAPPARASGASTVSNPASAGLSVKAMMEDHTRMMAEIQAAQVRILEATLARQRDTVATAVGKVAEKIDGQTDDFLSIMGQFANDLG